MPLIGLHALFLFLQELLGFSFHIDGLLSTCVLCELEILAGKARPCRHLIGVFHLRIFDPSFSLGFNSGREQLL